MTQPKRMDRGPGYSTSSTYLKTPICTAQVACDGINLVGAARERGICNKCREAQERRKKAPAPLRGENTALSMEARQMDAAKKKGGQS
jgi:hypothetical protein